MQGYADDVAAPFRCQGVTSSYAVSNGLVDLKRAATFYDRIIIIDADVFEPRLPEALGPDYDFLQDKGLIEVLPVTEYPNIPKGQPGHEYADKIRNGLAAALFSTEDVRLKSHEACGNGFARLQAAAMQASSTDDYFTPIVTSRRRVPSLLSAAQFYNDDPLLIAEQVEQILPVRATATRIVFDQLPVPTREVPWQDIFELRADNATSLYASRLRILLKKLAEETDRRHVEDLVKSEYADFNARCRILKGRQRRASVRWLLPFINLVAGAINLPSLLKAAGDFVKAQDEDTNITASEADLKKNPYYLLEHVRSRVA